MIRLFHVSDLHFGAEDKAALAWFRDVALAEPPDALVVTGDLTMRARSREFESAAAWLDSFPMPVSVEVGNHDLPYFNPFARLMRPYKRYRRLEQMIERPLELPGITVVPLKTTARAQLRLNWSKGSVSRSAIGATLAMIAAAPTHNVVLVSCHHPLVEADTRSTASTRGGPAALRQLAAAGVDAVLSGHVHDPFDRTIEHGGNAVRLIGAGTLSERIRDTAPSFNEIVVADGQIDVTVRAMSA